LRVLLEAKASPLLRRADGETALSLACSDGDAGRVALLLEHRAEVGSQAADKNSVLIPTVAAGQRAIVDLLVRSASREVLDSCDSKGMTALHTAAKLNMPEMMDILLDAGADPNSATATLRETPLMLCDTVVTARRLLAKGADPSLRDNHRADALMRACRRGRRDMVELLVEHRADVTAVDASRSTALIIACQNSFDLVPVLLRGGAASTEWINVENMYRESALTLAVKNNNVPAVQALVQAGANVNTAAYDGESLLRRARSIDVVRILLNAGAKDTMLRTNRSGENGTALTKACGSRNNLPLVKLLLEHKSNVNATSCYGTPLIIAAQRGDMPLLKYLLAYKPRPRLGARSMIGRTALGHAASSDCVPAVRALLEAKANPRMVDNAKNTPVMLTGSRRCIRLLIEAAPDTVNMVNDIGDTAIQNCFRQTDMNTFKVVKEILSCSRRCGVTPSLDAPAQNLTSPLEKALHTTNLKVVKLLLAHGAKLRAKSVLTLLKRAKRREGKDAQISACLDAVLRHALAVGHAVLPAVPTIAPAAAPTAVPTAVAATAPHAAPSEGAAAATPGMPHAVVRRHDEEDEEEEPVRKRRRRQ
jgi:ankyrin repeat protein